MVLNVPISKKWSLKFLFLHNWQFFQIFLAKVYFYIVSYKAYLERKNWKKQKPKKRMIADEEASSCFSQKTRRERA